MIHPLRARDLLDVDRDDEQAPATAARALADTRLCALLARLVSLPQHPPRARVGRQLWPGGQRQAPPGFPRPRARRGARTVHRQMVRLPASRLYARLDGSSYDTQDGLYDVAWSEVHENQLVTASGDGSIRLWDIMLNVGPAAAPSARAR